MTSFTETKENKYVCIDRPPVLDKNEVQTCHRLYEAAHRLQDVILSLLAVVIFAIPSALIALIIMADSPGASPIYVQKRVGKNGREFSMLKFRTMIPDAENKLDEVLENNEMDGPVFKLKNDPRITGFGRFLRRTSLDELPQFLNVLAGDMSVVGPRPPLPRETAQYGEYEKQRLYVTPGITCLWQVSPKRNELPFDRWLELDIRYIKERSVLLDWKIIFMTVLSVLRRDGI